MTSSTEKLLVEFRSKLKNVPVLEDEPDFFRNDEILLRFLKAREWNLKDAEKQLISTIDWRRKTRPLFVDCVWCHEKPGLHSMRQIGFDESGRPVIYSSFSQANCRKNTVDETIAHIIYLIENATKTMKDGITNVVLIIDCSGVTIQACNPKLGYEVTQILSNYYPERLGTVFCVNHSGLFQGIWKAIKIFLHPNTSKKVKLLKTSAMNEHFQKLFNKEMIDWLAEEIKFNKLKNINEYQRRFWFSHENHDPRGTSSYVEKYCQNISSNIIDHKPHPNIVDVIKGKLTQDESLKLLRKSSVNEISSKNGSEDCLDEWENLEDDDIIEIPVEYQISEVAGTLN